MNRTFPEAAAVPSLQGPPAAEAGGCRVWPQSDVCRGGGLACAARLGRCLCTCSSPSQTPRLSRELPRRRRDRTTQSERFCHNCFERTHSCEERFYSGIDDLRQLVFLTATGAAPPLSALSTHKEKETLEQDFALTRQTDSLNTNPELLS